MRENIVFILVRPTFSGNIGAAARVLKNFAFSDLRLVDPSKNYKEDEDKWMSVGAFDLLESALVFDSLADALADVGLAVATSSARLRDEEPLKFTDVVPLACAAASANKVAWVFGSEQNGLTKDELKRCHHIATIPTSAEFPVLSLAQAVGIVCWELARGLGTKSNLAARSDSLAKGAADDEFFKQLDVLLHYVGFTRTYNHDLVLQELRAMYQRMSATERELDLLKGALYKINEQLAQVPPEKRNKNVRDREFP